jgi:hypothetical protein
MHGHPPTVGIIKIDCRGGRQPYSMEQLVSRWNSMHLGNATISNYSGDSHIALSIRTQRFTAYIRLLYHDGKVNTHSADVASFKDAFSILGMKRMSPRECESRLFILLVKLSRVRLI